MFIGHNGYQFAGIFRTIDLVKLGIFRLTYVVEYHDDRSTRTRYPSNLTCPYYWS